MRKYFRAVAYLVVQLSHQRLATFNKTSVDANTKPVTETSRRPGTGSHEIVHQATLGDWSSITSQVKR